MKVVYCIFQQKPRTTLSSGAFILHNIWETEKAAKDYLIIENKLIFDPHQFGDHVLYYSQNSENIDPSFLEGVFYIQSITVRT